MGGLKFTLDTQPTAMKFAFSFTTAPTRTIGMGYTKEFLSIVILPITLSLLAFQLFLKQVHTIPTSASGRCTFFSSKFPGRHE
jgi:hypothetical protein